MKRRGEMRGRFRQLDGDGLRARRVALGLRLEDVVAATAANGEPLFTQGAISRIETGSRDNPQLSSLVAFASALDVTFVIDATGITMRENPDWGAGEAEAA